MTQLCEPSSRRVAFQWQKQKAFHNLLLCCKHMQPRAPLYTTEKPDRSLEAATWLATAMAAMPQQLPATSH